MAQLPFFYGWVVVAVAFVTMALGVNARTAFSLFFPAMLSMPNSRALPPGFEVLWGSAEPGALRGGIGQTG